MHRERVLLLGWGRAILLQLAHPLVAQGVRDHSTFRAGPLAPWRRLHGTLSAMLTLTFGAEREAAAVIGRINAIHDRVHGQLDRPAGPFPPGTPYSAHDPALLRWVHVTCVDSFLLAYERFVAPLTAAERDRYCAEASAIETQLGMPAGCLPRTAAEVQRDMARAVDGSALHVGDVARGLARDLLAPPGLRWLPPLAWLSRLPTIGLLPPAVRAGYGLRWTARDERALRVMTAVVRALVRLAPPVVRHWRRARAAPRRPRPPAARAAVL